MNKNLPTVNDLKQDFKPTFTNKFGQQKKVSDFATAYLADTISTNFPTDKKGFVQKSNASATKMTNGDAENMCFDIE